MQVTLTPYLNFNGQCAEAFRFYEKLLGGKVTGRDEAQGRPARLPRPHGAEDA
jgi:PhnB protein